MSNYAAQLDLAGTNRTLAIAMYKRAITLEPHLVTGYMNLAFAQREVEQYLDALEVCISKKRSLVGVVFTENVDSKIFIFCPILAQNIIV